MMDFTGRQVIIFGGGKVGTRKARYFADEADITIYSRSFLQELNTLPVKCISKTFADDAPDALELIKDAFLVITATSSTALNNTITDLACAHNILCNNASGIEGSVKLPAKISGDNYLICVSTCGDSPAISRMIRRHIEKTWPSLDIMIPLIKKFKITLKDKIKDQTEREKRINAVLDDDQIWDTLNISVESAKKMMEERYL